MALRIRFVPYYYARIEGDRDAAYDWLAELAGAEVDLIAFSAIPYGPNHVELTLFPVSEPALTSAATNQDVVLVGPYHALLIQGDDELGALARLHTELREAGVRVYASQGVTDGAGRFGYVVYVRERDAKAAADIVHAELTGS